MIEANTFDALMDETFSDVNSERILSEKRMTKQEFASESMKLLRENIRERNKNAQLDEQWVIPASMPWYLVAKCIEVFYHVNIREVGLSQEQVSISGTNGTSVPDYMAGWHSIKHGARFLRIIARQFNSSLSNDEMESIMTYLYDEHMSSGE